VPVHIITTADFVDYQYSQTNTTINAAGVLALGGPPLPPTITILTPTNGAQIVTGVGVVVSANAVAGTGAITNVSLYADNALLGSFAAPPYALTNSSLAIGAHALTAIASDNLGLTATNGISITILPLVSPAFTGIALNPDGAISLSFQVALGQSFQVQAATNLNPPVTWLSLVTNVSATTNVITFVDTNAPAYLKQFYRMVSP
jgi:hypothetical protein